ncbi:MAG: PA0069 family radical SAM protein [Deltaproteobacteria bacterium]
MLPRPIANPPNPWQTTGIEYLEGVSEARLEVYEDATRTILSSNDSPDIPFRWSVNPYRGCFHGCAYCYARPGHAYLGFGAGTDFERRVLVKLKAPELLREAFDRPSWRGEYVMFSGATDCYQPLEASYGLTRGCLEACAEYRNPIGIVTKSPIVERDIDVLQHLCSVASAHVTVSIPFWDPANARAIEPFVASPQRRMRIVAALSRAGIPTSVNIAPLIPGLTDEDMPSILAAAADAGACGAAMQFLRLPGSAKVVFEERLRAALPLRAERVLARVREMRGGRLNETRFGMRQGGEGPYAASVQALFTETARRLGLDTGHDPAADTTFARPPRRGSQLSLF